MMKTLYHFLDQVADYRRPQGRRFTLSAFLEMTILAGMSHRFGINGISRFIEQNKSFFIERYGLVHGVPKKTVIFNILRDLDYESLNDALFGWMSQYCDKDTEQIKWMSIDGKVLGSTVENPNSKDQNFQSIVSLLCSKLAVVINTVPFENKKGDEISCARKLIMSLEGQGITFTLDALHCQKKLLKQSWSVEMTI